MGASCCVVRVTVFFRLVRVTVPSFCYDFVDWNSFAQLVLPLSVESENDSRYLSHIYYIILTRHLFPLAKRKKLKKRLDNGPQKNK